MLVLMTACQSEMQNDDFVSVNAKEMKSSLKTSARTGDKLTLEEVKKMSLENKDVGYMNMATNQVVYHGELLSEVAFEYNESINPGANERRKVETVCSVSSGGVTHSVVHVYDNHYSGYQLQTSYGGTTYSSNMPEGPLFGCVALYLTNW